MPGGEKQLVTGRRAAWAAALAATFAGVHAAYYAAGARFDATPLAWFWQYVDAALLRGRLGESLLYLHIQPPLFNLFLGVVLKAAGPHAPAVFQAAYLGAGFVLYVSLFALQRRLGVSRPLAFASSTLFLASPSFILYEHWLFYVFPLAALVVAAAVLFGGTLARPGFGRAAAFFGALFALGAIWPVFHLAFYAAAAAATVALCPGARRKVAAAAAVPGLALAAVYVKNAVLFGTFAASSWTGMNWWEITGWNMSIWEARQLQREGALSDVAFVPPFSPLAAYPRSYADAGRFADVPVLARAVKTTGPPNFNHVGYVRIARNYGRDGFVVLRRFPDAYGRGLARSWYIYFQSTAAPEYAATFLNDAGNADRLRSVIGFWNRWFYGEARPRWLPAGVFAAPGEKQAGALYVVLLVGLPAAWGAGMYLAAARGRAGPSLRRDQRLALLFICGVILYVALAANMFSWAENNRMRFPTDALTVALAGAGIQRVRLRWRRSKNPRPA